MEIIRKIKKVDIAKCVEIALEAGSGEKINFLLNSMFSETVLFLEFYVYEENNIIKAICGLCNSLQDYQTYNLISCYVKPNFQGFGIGKKLVDFRLKKIRELKGQLVFSTTKETWHLERFGFKKIESPYKYYKVMQLNINYG